MGRRPVRSEIRRRFARRLDDLWPQVSDQFARRVVQRQDGDAERAGDPARGVEHRRGEAKHPSRVFFDVERVALFELAKAFEQLRRTRNRRDTVILSGI